MFLSEDRKLLIGAPVMPGLPYAEDNQEMFAICGHKVSLSLEAMAFLQKESDIDVACFFCAKEYMDEDDNQTEEMPGSRAAIIAEYGEEEGNRLYQEMQEAMTAFFGKKD